MYKENIIEVYGSIDENAELAFVNLNPDVDCRILNVGWAKRPKCGDTLGSITVQEFRANIRQWFYIESKESARKISPSRMLRLLKCMHHHLMNSLLNTRYNKW